MRWETRVQKALAEREAAYRLGVERHGGAMKKVGVQLASTIVMNRAEIAYGRGDDKVANALREAARELANTAREIYP